MGTEAKTVMILVGAIVAFLLTVFVVVDLLHAGKATEIAAVDKADATAAASAAQTTQRWADVAAEAQKDHDAELHQMASAAPPLAPAPVVRRRASLAAVVSDITGEAHSIYSSAGILHDSVLSDASSSVPDPAVAADLAEAARADRLAADCRELDAAFPVATQ